MASRLCVIAALLVSSALPAAAAPLQPTSKWEVQYSDVACTAKRAYGDYTLAFQPSPLGRSVRYVIEGPGRADAAHQFETDLIVADGGPPIRTSSLIYPLPDKGRRGMQLILSAPESDRLQVASEFSVESDLLARKKTGDRVRRQERMTANFDAKIGRALAKALGTCMADLRAHWGMVDGKLPEPAKPAKLTTRKLFDSGDYPAEAMANDQKGRTKFLLMIDEQGRVLDCVTDESSGVATLDTMSCQIMLQRAKFEPALDASGKPVKSIYVYSLGWQIAD